jgi:hypothetical protein
MNYENNIRAICPDLLYEDVVGGSSGKTRHKTPEMLSGKGIELD